MIALGYGFWSEWELYEKVDFDGPNKLIVVYPHVTNLDIREDVYSAWIRWFSMEDRNYDRYDLAMERKGLDDIPGGQTGDSYFTRNYWKLVVDFSRAAITGILYSRDYGSAYFAPDLAIQFAAQVSALVNTVTTVENVITGDIGTIEPKITEIHGQVERILFFDGSALTDGLGYQQNPYNLINSLVDYAEANGITRAKTKSDITLLKPIKNLRLEGIGLPTFSAEGFSLKGMEFWHLQFDGESDGADPFIIQECKLKAGAGVHGNVDDCVLNGNIKLTGHTHFTDCKSNIEGEGYYSIDTNGFIIQVSNWIRSLGINNMTSGVHTIHMEGGQLHCDAGCTGGTIYLRGNYSKKPENLGATLIIDQTEKANLLGTENFP